ncbi:hypothetical protein ABIA20_005290 [Sinorhizobium fredii]
MIEVKPITVFLRSNLAHEPFAGIDAQPRPLDSVVVDHFATVFGLEDVAFLAVGDLQDFVCESFHSSFARAGVLRTEVLIQHHPFANEAFGRHPSDRANLPQALAYRQLFEDLLSGVVTPLGLAGHIFCFLEWGGRVRCHFTGNPSAWYVLPRTFKQVRREIDELLRSKSRPGRRKPLETDNCLR